MAELSLQSSFNCQYLADSATKLFNNAQYDQCLEVVRKLQEQNKDNKRIAHNIAVAEFYKSRSRNKDVLKSWLDTAIQSLHSSSIGESDKSDDITEYATFYYNKSVILYHSRQYYAAIAVLDHLFQCIEPLDDGVAKKTCFLLSECYLSTCQAEKALNTLAYVETLLGGGLVQTDKQQDAKNQLSKDLQSSEDKELYINRLHQYRVAAYLQLKSMKSCKREIKSLVNTSIMPTSVSFLKSNFEFLRQNYRKSIKLLNAIPQPKDMPTSNENILCMFYNNLGCIHFCMRKHNLGCYYFRRAVVDNERVLTQVSKQGAENMALHSLGLNRRYELLYNCGIQLLHAGRPLSAFDCLVEAVQVFHTSPRLWLRIAECCIAASKGTPEEDSKGIPTQKKSIVQGVLGTGLHRKVVLTPSIQRESKCLGDGQSAAMPIASLEFAAICLRNALALLSSSDSSKRGDKTPPSSADTDTIDSTGKPTPASQCIPASPALPLRTHEITSLRCSILACSAYVCLGLGDHVLALHHSRQLLSQPKISGSLKYLGQMYAAEALTVLDDIPNALLLLQPDKVTDVSITIPTTVIDQQTHDRADSPTSDVLETQVIHRYFPPSINAARASMMFNLGSIQTLKGEYDKAKKTLQHSASLIPVNEVPPQAVLLGVYLELKHGNIPLALQMIKRNQLTPHLKLGDRNVSMRKVRK